MTDGCSHQSSSQTSKNVTIRPVFIYNTPCLASMETSKLFAVHIQGIMPADQTFIVSAYTKYHALDKAHTMFCVSQPDRSKYSIVKRRSVKAQRIINKF